MIILYSPFEVDFNNNGIAILDNICTKAEITQELNGDYSLDLELVKDEREKYLRIQPLSIIKADGQLFRIPLQTNIQDDGFNIKITANHIFYDLNNDFNDDIRAENKSVQEALAIAMAINSNFSVITCDNLGLNTAYFISENPTKSIYSKILDRWGGELYRDNFNVAIKSRIGTETSILISYGKNILGFEQTLDWSNLATRIKPVGKDGATIDLVNAGSKYLISPRVNDYPFIITKEVKFEDITDATELKNAGLGLWGTIDLPTCNYKVDFTDLSQIKEYEKLKTLLTLSLGDTVTIKHKVFNCNISARVIKIKKNILTERIEELELGQFKENIVNKFNAMDKQIAYNQSNIEETKADLKETKTTVFQNNEQIALQATAISDVEERVDAAELKITADAITSTVRSSQEYINDLGEKVTSEQASIISQTASNVKIGFNGVSDNVDISVEGLTINNGALKVKNANGEVTIDASKLMFRVLSYGQGSIVIENGSTNAAVSIAHNLGYSPAFKGQFRMYASDGTVETYSDSMNIIESDTGTVKYNARMFVTDTHLRIIINRANTLINSGSETFYYRWFIEEGVNL